MARLSDLYPGIRQEVEGCPVGVMDREIRMVVRQFCRATWYWLHDIEPLTLVPGVMAAPATLSYEIEVPEYARVLSVDELVYEGRPLLPVSDRWLDENFPGWRASKGDPRYYLQLSDRRVRFVPVSDGVKPVAVTGRLVLEPERRANEFGDVLLDYEDGLVSGVLSGLLSQAKPWSNPGRAGRARAEYLEAVSDAKAKVMQRFTDGVETVVQRSWL